jgi:hypothetical protein
MPLLKDGSQTVSGLLSGTTCTITEVTPDPPQTQAVSCSPGEDPVWTVILPDPVTIGTMPATATVQNILDCKQKDGPHGYVLVSKIIQNDTNDKSGAYTAALNALVYPVTVSCDGNQTPLNLSYGNQGVVHNVPVGQHCSVQEGTPPPPPPSSTACAGGLVPTWVTPPTYFPTTPQEVHDNAGPALSVTNRLICGQPHNDHVVPTLKCTPPQIPNRFGTACVCPDGKVSVRGEGCVAPPPPPKLVCKAPLVPNAQRTECVCREGMRRRGNTCVRQVVCHAPAKLNRRGTGCDCPKDYVKKGNSCVRRKRDEPRIKPDDVIRVLPGVIPGFGGHRGGDGNRRGGGSGGGGATPKGVR